MAPRAPIATPAASWVRPGANRVSFLFSEEWLLGHPESSGARLGLATSRLLLSRLFATPRDPAWHAEKPSFWPSIVSIALAAGSPSTLTRLGTRIPCQVVSPNGRTNGFQPAAAAHQQLLGLTIWFPPCRARIDRGQA